MIPYLRYSYGGPVRLVVDLSNRLVERGHHVSVYSTSVGSSNSGVQDASEGFDKRVDVQVFETAENWLSDGLRFQYSPRLRRRIKETIRDFDVAHVHEARGLPTAYAWHYSRMSGTPYFLQPHGSLQLRIPGQGFTRTALKLAYDCTIGRPICWSAYAMIALTNREAMQFKRAGVNINRTRVVPNGIDLREYERVTRGEFRRGASIDSNETVILFLGRIDKIKGLDTLVRAFRIVLERQPNCRLVIAGPDYGDLQNLRRLAQTLGVSTKVVFTGPLYGEKKLKLYADADVFVLPSIYETFPMSVIEACASGLPTIVTPNCGISDLLDGKFGIVAERNDKAIGDAIARLVDNPDLRKTYCIEGKRLARELFDINLTASRMERLYQSATGAE